MQTAKLRSFSRRSFALSLVTPLLKTSALAQTPKVEQTQFQWPDPVTIHEYIQVLDWRPFPSSDIPHFIAEIRNTGDESVVAPTVGLLVQHDESPPQYAWGNPWHATLAPGQSSFVFGNLDINPPTQESLNAATWVLCNQELPRSSDRETLASQLEWSGIEIHLHETWGAIDAVLTNTSDQSARWFAITGIVRDSTGRVAGASFRFSQSELQPNQSKEFRMYVQHFDIDTNWVSDNLANPYHILEPGEPWDIELSVDIRDHPINQSCPAVMPWNRDD